jgi:hypothetical protein
MPFNASLPVNNASVTATELRGQFNGLFDLIQTIPAGPAGPQGVPGTSVSGAVVDGVTTVGPLEPAAAGASFDGANVRFTFSIPRGPEGAQGGQGIQGIQGAVGPVGPPFTSFVVESVTTLDPAQPATVTAVFDGTNVKLAFGIPRGPQGVAGQQGITGATGATGPAFTSFVVDAVDTLPPGNQATVQTAFDGTSVRFTFGIPQGAQGLQGIQGLPGPSDLSGTSNNSNGVSVLGMAVSDPPTQGEMQAIANKLDELINALRR